MCCTDHPAIIVQATVALFAVATTAKAQTVRNCLAPDSTSAALQRLAVTIASDTTAFARGTRSKYAIPALAPAQVSLAQDSTVCERVTAAIESSATVPIPEALVTVQIGDASPFYLATERRNGVMGSIYLLNSSLALLAILTSGG